MHAKHKRQQSFFRLHITTAKQSLVNLIQRPLGNLLTLLVITLSLMIPTSLYVVGKNTANLASNVASPSNLNVYLSEGSAEARIMLLKDQIESIELVESVEYISAQQGIAELSEYTGFNDALSLLDGYALPAVLVVTPLSDNTEEVRQLTTKLSELDGVSDVQLNEDWLERFSALRSLSNIVSISIAILLLLAVVLIVGNTIRFSVLSHKEEIQVMKLIGATDSYIMRPYLYSGIWYGFMSAMLTWLLTATMVMILGQAVASLTLVFDSPFRLVGLNWDESLILLLLGSFLGLLAANISTRRHLKEIEPV